MALTLATIFKRIQIVELLLAKGADVNERAAMNKTPLMWAAQTGTIDIVRLFLAHGAKVNAEDEWEMSALKYAMLSKHHRNIVQQLLAHESDPDLASKDGTTPFSYAQKNLS